MLSQATPILTISVLNKGYRDGDTFAQVLQGVDLQVHAGTSLALTGPSGCGKSTLLNLIAGMLAPDAGQIVLQGERPLALHCLKERERTRTRRQFMGYIHQFFNLVPTLTVLENVRLPATLNQLDDSHGRALNLLGEFGLDRYVDKYPHNLSGGEQQRVAVARALVHEPILLLADEPTGNLDAGNAERVADTLFAAAKTRGTAVILATHNEQIAQRAQHRLRLDAAVP